MSENSYYLLAQSHTSDEKPVGQGCETLPGDRSLMYRTDKSYTQIVSPYSNQNRSCDIGRENN